MKRGLLFNLNQTTCEDYVFKIIEKIGFNTKYWIKVQEKYLWENFYVHETFIRFYKPEIL